MQTRNDPVLKRRGLLLEYLTISWNAIEAFVAVGAGLVANSIALVGFGFDSTIEVFAASVTVWQLKGTDSPDRTRRALRLIAITFFVLAAYVIVDSVRDLVTGEEPDESAVGIVLATTSLIVMPTLAWFKQRTGIRMGNPVLVADAAETYLCAWLSAILLAGLVANSTFGWWWADPVAAISIAGLAVREGLEAWAENDDEETE